MIFWPFMLVLTSAQTYLWALLATQDPGWRCISIMLTLGSFGCVCLAAERIYVRVIERDWRWD